MTTKEQERQAIQKVKKIVEGMGENSYLATAMEGVLETAEENIEYDAAFSLKGRAEVAEKEVSEFKKENCRAFSKRRFCDKIAGDLVKKANRLYNGQMDTGKVRKFC